MLGAMPDALQDASARCNARTDERTDERRTTTPTTGDRASVGNAHAPVEPPGFVYIVHWPEAEFTKVGCSIDSRRWRPFLRRGGVLLGVIQPAHPPLVEWRMHVDLCSSGVPRKFATSAEARPYLGGAGRGFTECYVDSTGRDVLAALLEVERTKPMRWKDR